MPTLLDTHAWVWWVSEDSRLSRTAKTAIARAQSSDDLGLSLISIWEVAKKVEKGKLAFDRPLGQWLEVATTVRGLHLWEITKSILVESCSLPKPFHGDPADQIIVATARSHEATLITRDDRIRSYAHVRTLW